MFKQDKTAQMAAYLLSKEADGRMKYIKLIKLLYLADRESMRLTGDSMSRDHFYSLKKGPILSATLNLLSARSEAGPVWASLIQKTDVHFSKLTKPINVDELDELSPLNIEILDRVYGEFAHMGEWELIDWIHANLPEWEQPGNSRLPIEPASIFRALGWKEDEARALGERYKNRRQLEQVMAN